MKFDEMIRLQALKLKALNAVGTDNLRDSPIQDRLFAEAFEQGQLRNICAMVSPELFDQVEQACSLLEISKRRFVESALIEAVDRAEAIVADVAPFERGE